MKTLELIIRLPIMLLWWVVQIAIKLPWMIIGLVAIPFTFKYRNVPLNDLPWYIKMFANPEDQPGGYPGYLDSFPNFWHNRMKVEGWSLRYAHWHYHAIRNPADGLRNIPWLNVIPKPEKIKFVTRRYYRHYEPRLINTFGEKFAYYFCWQGFWLGMHDSYEINIDPNGTRAQIGASMATKFLPYRNWG
jgi:hypothetical protein